jgi:hypothetical protein
MSERYARQRTAWLAIAGLVMSMLLPVVPVRAEDATTVHGSSDTFTAPGVMLAWAIERGASDAAASVVVGIATDAQRYRAAALVGIDPFSQARRAPIAAVQGNGSLRIRVARASFADFPRSEIRLYADMESLQADRPALVVYYLGVPDTTPELPGEAGVERYFAERLRPPR